MSESFLTPTSMLPFSRKPIPPNIFFSSMPFFRASPWRMRSASASSKAISNLQGSLVVKHRVLYLDGKKGPQTGGSRGLLMTKADKALVILLRFVGVTGLFALVAVF